MCSVDNKTTLHRCINSAGNKVFLIASSLKMLKDKATKWLSSSEDDPPSVYTSDGTEIFDEEVFEVISQTDTTLLILKSGETLINYDVHKSTLQPDLSSSTDTDISSERSDFIDSEESASILSISFIYYQL
ncbi:uncharacterized protein LOC141901751 [Tubulanus polymorphus]|uniref:uncharacterized protein LOC141901751 n=1 Tax=Tubulanus polymorphus TaxID=672921 RepID=UPI003DA5FFA1